MLILNENFKWEHLAFYKNCYFKCLPGYGFCMTLGRGKKISPDRQSISVIFIFPGEEFLSGSLGFGGGGVVKIIIYICYIMIVFWWLNNRKRKISISMKFLKNALFILTRIVQWTNNGKIISNPHPVMPSYLHVSQFFFTKIVKFIVLLKFEVGKRVFLTIFQIFFLL